MSGKTMCISCGVEYEVILHDESTADESFCPFCGADVYIPDEDESLHPDDYVDNVLSDAY